MVLDTKNQKGKSKNLLVILKKILDSLKWQIQTILEQSYYHI